MKKRHKAFSLFCQLLGHFHLFWEGHKGGTGHSVYVTSLHSERGPQLVFCVNRGSTCHLISQPDPGVLARKGLRASHRDTETAFVSFLPNFISAVISLFPWVYSFPSLLLPLPFFFFFYSRLFNQRKWIRKIIVIVRKKKRKKKKKKTQNCHVWDPGESLINFHFHRLVPSLAWFGKCVNKSGHALDFLAALEKKKMNQPKSLSHQDSLLKRKNYDSMYKGSR